MPKTLRITTRFITKKTRPEITDAAYDSLRQRYNALRTAFPHLAPAEDPEKAGAAPAAGKLKVTHSVPMLSLGNAFTDADVQDFETRVRRFL